LRRTAKFRVRYLLSALAAVWLAVPGEAAVEQDQVLFDFDPTANARFGSAIGTDANYAVIGAPGDESFSGSAYIWGYASLGDSGAWIRLGKIKADSPSNNSQFGKVVDISGDVVVVGSPFWARDGYGAAYVYRFDGAIWQFEQRLTPTSTTFNSNSGWSVAVSGDVIVISAFYSLSAKVFIYRHDGVDWVKEQDLPFTGTGDVPVDVSGDTIALKSPTLKIFRYTGSTWVEEDDLGSAGAFALDGDRLLVGDPVDDLLGENAGAAIVYRRNGADWEVEQTLRAADSVAGDRFGIRVSLTLGRALIFASGDEGGVGSGYIFDFDGASWGETEKLVSSDAVLGEQFGSALGVIDRSALIGASWYTREFTQDGIAYAYELVPEPSASLLGATVLVVLSALARRKPVDIDRG
jgi:hypothetical protein